MNRDSYYWYQAYQPWRRRVEIGFWIAVYSVTAVFNSLTALMDVKRQGLPYAGWEPVSWESSSALAMLILVPFLVWLSRRVPLALGGLHKVVALYLLTSLAFSAAHVLLMVGFRHGAYAFMSEQYQFGPWPRELLYEYLKDARTFFASLFVIELYRFALRRLHGEARLLDTAEHEPPRQHPERFLVKMLGREYLVPTDQIEWARASGNYVNLHVGARDYPLRSTLSGLAKRLDPARFLQTHRSWLVNIEKIREIEPLESGDARIKMTDGTFIPCSRKYRDKLKALCTADG